MKKNIALASFFASILFIILGQIFFLSLNFSAVYTQNLKFSTVVEDIIASDLANRLGKIVRFGRNLDRYNLLGKEVEKAVSLSKARYFLVADEKGKVLFGQTPLDSFALPDFETKIASGDMLSFKEGNLEWIGRLIPGDQGKIAGYVLLSLDKDAVSLETLQVVLKYKIPFILITAFTILFFIILFYLYQRRRRAGKKFPLHIYVVFLLPFMTGLALYYAVSYAPIQKLGTEQTHRSVVQLGRSLTRDLEHLASLNVPLQALPNIDRHLVWLESRLDIIDGMFVVIPDGGLLVGAKEGSPIATEEFSKKSSRIAAEGKLVLPIDTAGQAPLYLEIWLNGTVLRNNALRSLLDNLTMSFISCLLLAELARLTIFSLASKRTSKQEEHWSQQPGIMRPIVFICLFALDLSLSFIPLRMLEFQSESWFLPKELMLGLPISAEMLMVGVATISGGFLADRLGGWRPMFICGIFLAGLGYVLSGWADSAMIFILGRALAGLGYGSLNIASQFFVIGRSTSENRGFNLAMLSSGFFSGGLCGCAAGGLLADRLGFSVVFYLSAGLFFLLFLGLLILFPPDPVRQKQVETEVKTSLRAVFQFLKDRRVWGLGLFHVLPLAIATVGLFNFFLPLYMNGIGAGSSAVGQLNMLFSLFVVFLGPIFGRAVDSSGRKYLFIVLAGLLAALSLIPLFLMSPVLGAILAVCLMGLAHAVTENAHGAWLLGLPPAITLGANPTLSLYNAAIRIGQILGPVIFALALGSQGESCLVWISAFVAVSGILFWMMAAIPSGKEQASS